MAARPAEGPHESSRLVCEAVRRVSNTVSRADPAPLVGLTQNKKQQETDRTPRAWGENMEKQHAACRQDA